MQPNEEIQVDTNDLAGALAAFDALAPGGALVVVADVSPRALLDALQAQRSGAFDWNVLAAAPRFRVEVARRAGAGPRSVSECLETDHRRLDGILVEAARLVRAERFAEAGACVAELVCGLERHIVMEEEVLFPAFEERTGMRGGPTVVMRNEHCIIRACLRELAETVAESDAARFHAAAEALVGTLGPHNMKEERILYPMSDRSAGGDAERDALVREMQRV